jgi:hypothetical protein
MLVGRLDSLALIGTRMLAKSTLLGFGSARISRYLMRGLMRT